jgi:hypothetical protein
MPSALVPIDLEWLDCYAVIENLSHPILFTPSIFYTPCALRDKGPECLRQVL